MSGRLLLISNSTNHGRGFLDHCLDEVADHLAGLRRLAFVPFALYEREAYGRKVGERLQAIGLETTTVTADEKGHTAVTEAEAIFVGGGNTFRLLDTLQRTGILEAIRARAVSGTPYIGSSAGTNLASPTIRTTNDMPIVQPASFAALNLIPFQINPHYLDPVPGSTHMGETRETRLLEYLEENEVPVLGLREGAWIRVDGNRGRLGGERGARLFHPGRPPEERAPGATLDDLLSPTGT
jgi:dipeptidase E